MARKPSLNAGDLVSEKAAIGEKRIGSVVRVYEFSGKVRYVVQFDDGSERVFFDFELDTESSNPSKRQSG